MPTHAGPLSIAQRVWLWTTLRSPLAFFTRHVNFTESGGDHDNKLEAVMHFYKSFAVQVIPVAVLCFVVPCWVLHGVHRISVLASVPLCLMLARHAFVRGWRWHKFTVVISTAPYTEGDPLVFSDWKSRHPGASMQEFLYAKNCQSTKDVLYSRSRENQFAHEMVAFFASFGVSRCMYQLVRGDSASVFQFLSPEAVFRPSVVFDALRCGKKNVERFYKHTLSNDWAEHKRQFIAQWFDANSEYDLHFRDYIETIQPRDWVVAVNGGPFTYLAQLCRRNSNVVAVSMAFSADTTKNIFKQNANCLFDMEAAADVVGATDAPSAYISLNVDTTFVKEQGPRFLGRTPAESADAFNKEMGGNVDDETLTMYRDCTFIGAPTPWEKVVTKDGVSYGTFYVFDTLAVSLLFQGRWDLFAPSGLRRREHTGNFIHDKGMYDLCAPDEGERTFFVTHLNADVLAQYRMVRAAKNDLRELFRFSVYGIYRKK